MLSRQPLSPRDVSIFIYGYDVPAIQENLPVPGQLFMYRLMMPRCAHS